MAIKRFPPFETADEHGLLALGGDLEIESLLLAYRSGVFPWPLSEDLLAWFAPPKRTVLFLDDFKPSRSLQREVKRAKFKVDLDRDFSAVVKACAAAKNRKGQKGTWITKEMVAAYVTLHEAGHAHSIESRRNGKLCGGIYGVSIGGFFAGESMFYTESNASKVALYQLVEHLKARGAEWIDCQVMTPHMETFGAVEIERSEYMKLLSKALKKSKRLF